jgi:hypothetical protein
MAFPTTPTNGDVYVDPITNRTWFYESAITSWRILERETLGSYTTVDVATVPPIDKDVFAYDATGVHFQNDSTVLTDFDVLYDGNAAAPTSTDLASAGEVWRDATNEDAYLCVTYTPPSTATIIDVPSTATGSLAVNAGESIAQSFTIPVGNDGVYNRLTLYFGTTDTFDFQLDIYAGTNVDGVPIMTQVFLAAAVSPGPSLFSFTDTSLMAGIYSWKVTSLAGNNAISVRRSAGTGYTDGAPVTGTGVVHSLTLLGLNQDWGFQVGYDVPTGVTEWMEVTDPANYTQRIWKDSIPPPITPLTDGLLWHDTTVGRTFMYDIDVLTWVQL